MPQRAVPVSDVPPVWRRVIRSIAVGKAAAGGAGLGLVVAGLVSLLSSPFGVELANGYLTMQLCAAAGAVVGLALGLRETSRLGGGSSGSLHGS